MSTKVEESQLTNCDQITTVEVPLSETLRSNPLPVVSYAMLCQTKRRQPRPRTWSFDYQGRMERAETIKRPFHFPETRAFPETAQRNKPVPFTVFTDLFPTIAYCALVEGSSVPIFLPSIVRHYHDRVEHQGRGITINKLQFNNYGNIGCFKLYLEVHLLSSPWRWSNTANDSRPAWG